MTKPFSEDGGYKNHRSGSQSKTPHYMIGHSPPMISGNTSKDLVAPTTTVASPTNRQISPALCMPGGCHHGCLPSAPREGSLRK